MSEFYGGLDRSYTAGEAIAKGQLVALDASDETSVNVATALTAELVIGIATESADEGSSVNVRMQGIAELSVAEAVDAGDVLCAGVDAGQAQKYATGDTNYIVGKALTAAAEDGYAECMLSIGSASEPGDIMSRSLAATAVRPANAGDAVETDDPSTAAAVLRLDDNIVEAKGTGTDIDVILKPKGAGAVSVPAGTYETAVTGDDDIPNKKFCDDSFVPYKAKGQSTTGTGATVGQVAVASLTAAAVILCIGAEAGADVAYVVAASGHFTVFDSSDAEIDGKKVNYVVLSL